MYLSFKNIGKKGKRGSEIQVPKSSQGGTIMNRLSGVPLEVIQPWKIAFFSENHSLDTASSLHNHPQHIYHIIQSFKGMKV